MNAFSSPIGAFIFLIVVTAYENYNFTEEEFSSPIGAFIFLMEVKTPPTLILHMGFRPLSGLLFS